MKDNISRFHRQKRSKLINKNKKRRDMMTGDVFFFFRNFPDQIMKQKIEKLIDGRGSNYVPTSFD